MDIEPASQGEVKDAMDSARDAGLTVEANGSGMQSMQMPGGSAELVGLGIALLVLVLTFGSLIDVVLPPAPAVFAVGLGMLRTTGTPPFMDLGPHPPIPATKLGPDVATTNP